LTSKGLVCLLRLTTIKPIEKEGRLQESPTGHSASNTRNVGHGSSSSVRLPLLKVFQASERLQDAYALSKMEKGETMRSDLIFGALTHVNNRYELCQLASKATRKLHKPNTRLQDTTNEVLDRFKDTVPMDESDAVVEKVQLQERRAA
jgi:hypothetical protein